MEVLDRPIDSHTANARLDDLAAEYRDSNSGAVRVLTLLDGQMDGLLQRLPSSLRDNLEWGTGRALHFAFDAACKSRTLLGHSPNWFTTAASATLGAAGGFSGLPGTLAELPVTTTVLLHGIQGAAIDHGFDTSEDGIRFECIQMFAAPGPLEQDNDLDLSFISVRTAVTGTALQALISRVAPRLGVVLGQKLAVQAAAVLGAAAGASINIVYAHHYRRIALAHFGLRRLAIDADRSHAELVGEFRKRLRPWSG